MAARDETAGFFRGAIVGLRARQLGGACGDSDDAAAEVIEIFADDGIAPALRCMRTHLVRSEIGPVEMHANKTRAVSDFPLATHGRAGLEHRIELRRRACGGCRENGGRAVTRVRTICDAYSLRRSIHVIRAIAAVYVN